MKISTLFSANQYGIYIKKAELLKTDFNITPQDALECIPLIFESKARDRDKIDALLKIDAVMYCNVGIETSKKDRAYIKSVSNKIYKAIGRISPEDEKLLIKNGD